jgi:tryptophanyl-tRNA synthetase
MGLLERCHSYKDKLARGIAASHGLFCYPVLMAADILLYESQLVPVGRDQKQHLEVTRDIAIKFNERYGETFILPEPLIQDESAIVPGLDGQKMSKSYNNSISLAEDEKSFRKKIMSIKTDSTPVEQPKPTDASIILQLYKLCATPQEYTDMENSFRSGGRGYGDYKKMLADKLWKMLATFREKRQQLLAQPGLVKDILHAGAQKARAVARATINKVREVTGLGALPSC